MQPGISLGRNRTGIKASPVDAGELREMLDSPVDHSRPQVTADDFRIQYMDEGATVGSVPPPTTVKGVIGARAKALTGHRMHVLLDKLGERAAFERAGVRLYDAMLRNMARFDRLPGDLDIGPLQQMRDEEASHFALLCESIEQLGGDSTTQTPCADIAGVQGMGLMQVMNDPRTTLAQCLQTLLAAELVDNASWQLLVELASGFSQDELATDFRRALTDEQRHEARVRDWLATELDAVAHVRH